MEYKKCRSKSTCQRRMKGVKFVKPIVYGSISHRLEEVTSEGHTHGWKVYVKPYENEDMSVYVREVRFQLHGTYDNPKRVVTEPPYEVNETGWGEFTINITIVFRDRSENMVNIEHILKLNPDPSEKKPLNDGNVVSEFYDELIFQDPTPRLYRRLKDPVMLTGEHVHQHDYAKKSEQDLSAIMTAKLVVKAAISKTTAQLEELKRQKIEYREKIEACRAKLAECTASSNIAECTASSSIAECTASSSIAECTASSDTEEYTISSNIAEYPASSDTEEYTISSNIAEYPASSDTEEYTISSNIAECTTSSNIAECTASSNIAEYPASSNIAEYPASSNVPECTDSSDTEE